VEIERLGHETGWTWAPTAHAQVGSDGSFTAVWRANHIGRFAIRAVIVTSSAPRGAAASPSLTITVYRPAGATLYGPGFWGHKTACGQTLRRRTLGVANRTLPCGTQIAIYYHGRTITVPVIDRGPYRAGYDWDLTMATAHALGIPGTVTIGAVSLPRRR
jgi:rare lipoprotein A (peptidoglycan hydrolase)